MIFNGKKTKATMIKWLSKFQKEVNKLCGTDILQWTKMTRQLNLRELLSTRKIVYPTSIWNCFGMTMVSLTSGSTWRKTKPSSIWTKEVHTKRRVSKQPPWEYSTAWPSCNSLNMNLTMDVIYLIHTKALSDASLTSMFPTIQECLSSSERTDDTTLETKREARSRQTYFCLDVSDFWSVPVHTVLKSLSDKFNLSWLWISMSYHRFSNLRDLFQADLSKKLLVNVCPWNLWRRNAVVDQHPKLMDYVHSTLNACTSASYTKPPARWLTRYTSEARKIS